LIEQLLHACPNLKIIASSREALGIAGETVYRVPPLSLPDPAFVTKDALAQCESVQLFVERAAAAHPKFNLNEHNAAAIAQICRRLDGIPLALELAAARVTVFSAEQIASHLDDRFKLLTGGSRTALPRQQTLRALIDWSYDLLPEDERSLLRRLSVFAGGWTYEAAEAVCSGLDVLNLLGQLVNKSLVAMDDEGGEPRYRLLETVRQYAREKLLEMGEAEPARIAHFDFFFKLAETAEPMLESSNALEWIQRLERDYDNIRAALGWGIDNNVEAVLRMVPSMVYFWNRRGLEEEGRHLIREALSRSDKLPTPEGESGRRTKSAIAEAWQTLAMLAYSQGDNTRAVEASEQAANLAREVGNKRLLALTLAFRASGKMFLGIKDGVEAILEEAIAAARESGDTFAMGLPLTMYGQASAMLESDSKIAREYAKEGTILMQEAGNRWGATMALLSMAMIDKYSGNYSEARAKFAACEPRFRALGDRHRMNMVKSELAHIDRYEGHYQQAEAVYRETIREWQRLGHRAAVAHQFECLASVAKVQEQGRRAATLFGSAQALREKIGISMTPFEKVEYDREVEDLRRGLDQGVFDSSWAEGRAMSMDQAITFALEAKSGAPQ
jgi:non-specific serine/threonine protein kinase